jgi:hypothetical protein
MHSIKPMLIHTPFYKGSMTLHHAVWNIDVENDSSQFLPYLSTDQHWGAYLYHWSTGAMTLQINLYELVM